MWPVLLASVIGLAAVARPAAPKSADDQYRAALDLLYDGSTDTAIAQLADLAEAHPQDPLAAYFQVLALCWKIEQRPESTTLDKALLDQVDVLLARTAALLRAHPDDARARLARGAAFGVRSRLFLFRAKARDAARAAEAMREELTLIKDNEDARFGLGLYDYYVDVLPRYARLLRFLSGMPGGERQRGLAAIEEAKETSLFHRVEAAAQLYEIYGFFEKEPDRAFVELRRLHDRYPGAPLWALKLAEHERERLGLYAESAAVAREIVRAAARRDPNYGSVAGALGRVAQGEALLLDLRLAEARRVLLYFRDGFEDAPRIAARARLLLGRALELEGDREAALVHYRAAALSTDKDTAREAEHAVHHPLPDEQTKATPYLADARRFREAGRLRDAVAAYRSAMDAWPDCAEARLRVAEDDLRRGRVEVARETLNDLRDLDDPQPPWVRPWTSLLQGYLFDLGGDRTAAVRQYNKVLEEPYGDVALAKEAKARLRQPFIREDTSSTAPEGQ